MGPNWEIANSKSTTRTLIKKVEESLKGLIVPGILFDELGFRYFGPIDGHDLDMVVKTLDNIKDIQNPVLLHILTKKGKGMVSLNMNNREYHDDAVKFHAVKPNGKAKPSEKIEKKINSEKPVPSFQDVLENFLAK